MKPASKANRSISVIWDPSDGSLLVRARLPAETGRLFMNALEKVIDTTPRPRVSAETSAVELA